MIAPCLFRMFRLMGLHETVSLKFPAATSFSDARSLDSGAPQESFARDPSDETTWEAPSPFGKRPILNVQSLTGVTWISASESSSAKLKALAAAFGISARVELAANPCRTSRRLHRELIKSSSIEQQSKSAQRIVTEPIRLSKRLPRWSAASNSTSSATLSRRPAPGLLATEDCA